MNRAVLRLYFTLNVVLLVMLLLVLPFIDFDSPAGTITKLNLLILVPSTLGSGALLYRELRHREPYRPDDWETDDQVGPGGGAGPPIDRPHDRESGDRDLPWEEP